MTCVNYCKYFTCLCTKEVHYGMILFSLLDDYYTRVIYYFLTDSMTICLLVLHSACGLAACNTTKREVCPHFTRINTVSTS